MEQDSGRQVIIGNSEENREIYESNYISTTRYTVYNFFFKALLLQFKRYANIYFLIMAILQSIPRISPLNPLASIAALAFVIGLSMLREALEDYSRYKSDIELNSSKAWKYEDGGWKRFEWKNLFVGDLIKVYKDDFFPVDMILLGSSHKEGIAHIQTSSLDGEKNLKPRMAFKSTQVLVGHGDVMRIIGSMELPPPNSNLYDARGTISIGGDPKLNIGDKNFMLRGAILKNTDWIIGVCAYTGKDTKIMKNAEDAKHKQSSVEKMTNQLILMIFGLQLIICFVVAIFSANWISNNREKYKNFVIYKNSNGEDESILKLGIFSFGTLLVLTNSMIPISLIISSEFVKLAQAYFINNDNEMYNAESDRNSKVFTSSLNEELGQIEFIFSDKTGTLTCNKMEFKMCIIGDVLYGDSSCIEVDPKAGPQKAKKPVNIPPGLSFYDERVADLGTGLKEDKKCGLVLNEQSSGQEIERYNKQSDLVDEFFYLLSLCHDCVLEKDEDGTRYEGESPDEIALVKTAKQMGFMFNGESSGVMNLIVHGKHEPIEKLILFPFNSTRKRASIIVRLNGKIKLLTKGADSIIIERLAPASLSPQPYLELYKGKLEEFSKIGLRTLCMAERVITEKEFKEIQQKYNGAAMHKEAKKKIGKNLNLRFLAELAEGVERNLTLIGCTAVEDRLQDEVPETIRDMLKASKV